MKKSFSEKICALQILLEEVKGSKWYFFKWTHIYESAIGAHIVADAYVGDYRLYYWRENDEEVDYVIVKKGKLVAVEVKSNSKQWNSGLKTFSEKFHPYLSIVVGDGGMKAEDFLKADPALLFK